MYWAQKDTVLYTIRNNKLPERICRAMKMREVKELKGQFKDFLNSIPGNECEIEIGSVRLKSHQCVYLS